MSDEGSLFGGDLGELEAVLRARAANRTKTQLIKEVSATSLPPASQTVIEESDLFRSSIDDTTGSSQLFVGELGSLEAELRAKFTAVPSTREALQKLKSEWKASKSSATVAVHADKQWTRLHQAALTGDIDEARKLLSETSSFDIINAQNSSGQTALHVAVLLEHAEVARLLITQGANLSLKDVSGKTPLDEAVSSEFLAEIGLGSVSSHGELQGLQTFECLGRGTDGAVYRGKLDDQEVAVKTVDWTEASKTEIVKKRFARESEILKLISGDSPRVIKFIAASTSSRPFKLVTEYCGGGTLYNLIHERKSTSLDKSVRIRIASQAAEALAHVHKFNFMHLDFKSLNLLVELEFSPETVNVKLCDFGSARRVGETSLAHPDAGDGTYFWSAPEVLARDEHDISTKSDVYSWAIVAHEVLTRTLPFVNLRQEMLPPFAIAIRVADGERPDLVPVHESGGLLMVEIIESAWAGEPSKRPTMSEISQKMKSL